MQLVLACTLSEAVQSWSGALPVRAAGRSTPSSLTSPPTLFGFLIFQGERITHTCKGWLILSLGQVLIRTQQLDVEFSDRCLLQAQELKEQVTSPWDF